MLRLKIHRITASAANACGFLLAPKSKTTRTGTSPSLRIVRESFAMLASDYPDRTEFWGITSGESIIQQLTLLIDGDLVSVSQEVSRFVGDNWVFIVDVCPNQRQCQVIGSGGQCCESIKPHRIGKRRIKRAFE